MEVMGMRLFDTLSGRKREFRPLRGDTVRIYTCGPSVYSYSHIGNFRTYLFEDILVRYLKHKGYGVKRVMNITDVEDKAVKAAREQVINLRKLAKDKTRAFFEDFDALGMERPDVVSNVSEYVPLMVKLIEKICSKKYCMKEKDGIYFSVRKFGKYGNLRKLKNRKYKGVSRKDDYAREGLWDFRLWKYWTRGDGDAVWKSPFGKGRPGWHIECSAISMHFLGESFDIHCGGTDNIFPHHENEIAQSESATGKPLANFWMHAKHLTVRKRKMSKRGGTVYYVKELRKMGVPPKCLRFYLISEKYRNRLDFTIQKFKWKVCNCEDVSIMIKDLKKLKKKGDGRRGERIARRLIGGFENAMDDDLNTKLAFRRIFSETGKARRLMAEKKLTARDAELIVKAIERIDGVLRVF
jgi:cysteinyl-tRNA synthetase